MRPPLPTPRPRSRATVVAALVKQDYAAVAGKVVMLKSVTGYDKAENNVDRPLDPPVAFRVSDLTPQGELCRVVDDWIDPIWDVEPVNPDDPQIEDLQRFYCYGTSYHLYSEESEAGDLAVEAPVLKVFKVPYTFTVVGEIQIPARDDVDAKTQAADHTATDLLAHGRTSEFNIGLPVEIP